MAQQAGPSGAGGGGKNPLGIISFWPSKGSEPTMLWELWVNCFQWVMVPKHSINPTNFCFASTVDVTQIAALPGNVEGKNRLESDKL